VGPSSRAVRGARRAFNAARLPENASPGVQSWKKREFFDNIQRGEQIPSWQKTLKLERSLLVEPRTHARNKLV